MWIVSKWRIGTRLGAGFALVLLLMIALSETLGWLLACGLWLLVGAGFTIVACMLVERDRRRAELAAA